MYYIPYNEQDAFVLPTNSKITCIFIKWLIIGAILASGLIGFVFYKFNNQITSIASKDLALFFWVAIAILLGFGFMHVFFLGLYSLKIADGHIKKEKKEHKWTNGKIVNFEEFDRNLTESHNGVNHQLHSPVYVISYEVNGISYSTKFIASAMDWKERMQFFFKDKKGKPATVYYKDDCPEKGYCVPNVLDYEIPGFVRNIGLGSLALGIGIVAIIVQFIYIL